MALSILVVIHELGHFLFAKLFKTRVEKFYLFFDPWFSLFKIKRGDTEYGIGWLPLGGYVKISGMIDESLDKEQMLKPPQPWEFRSKTSGQRLLIMTGGVMFNFILAMVIYSAILFTWGETYLETKNAKFGIVTDSLGYEMGLRNGDKILTVDNQYIANFHQINSDIILNQRSTIQVERNGVPLNININKDFVPLMLKGQGSIDARVPFGPFIVHSFEEVSPSRLAGLEVEDQIVGIDSIPFDFYDEFQSYLAGKKGQPIILNVLREGEELNLPMVIPETGLLGLSTIPEQALEISRTEYGFFQAIPAGVIKGVKTVKDYLKQFRLIFSKKNKGYESLGGFITIGSIFPGVWDWNAFWNLTAFLSVILAIMNILPIPALDGGHVMFLLWEVVTGRKPNDKVMEYAQIVGMLIIFSLLIFANGNDILRFIIRK